MCKRGEALASYQSSFLLMCVFIKKYGQKKLLLCLIDDASEMAAAEGVNKLNTWSIYIKRQITWENQSFLCVFPACVYSWWVHVLMTATFFSVEIIIAVSEMLTQSADFLNRRLMIMIYWGNNKHSCKKISDLKFNISSTLKCNGIQCIN